MCTKQIISRFKLQLAVPVWKRVSVGSSKWKLSVSSSNMSRHRQHRVQLSSHQRVRDHQEETQVVPGLPLHEVSDCGHAEGG